MLSGREETMSQIVSISKVNKQADDIPDALKLSLESKINQFFTAEEQKLVKIPLPEVLKLRTCTAIERNAIKTLNHLKRYTVGLGTLNIEYNLPINKNERVYNLMGSIPRDSPEVKVDLDKYSLDTFSTTKLLSSKEIQYGIFTIGLSLCDRLGLGAIGHCVSGYIDKESQTIIVYDGASWINFDAGTHKLKEYFNNLLPSYQLTILAKSHQALYGTCSMFQPAAAYLMILFGRDNIIKCLDEVSVDPAVTETIIDNAVIDLFEYSKKIMPFEEDKPVTKPAVKHENIFTTKEEEYQYEKSRIRFFDDPTEKGEFLNHSLSYDSQKASRLG